ncbi:MAG: hypothetical protein ABI211_08575, partial [Vicinamibacterales bacterium]
MNDPLVDNDEPPLPTRRLEPLLATPITPSLDREIISAFGPHLSYSRGHRLDTGVEPERLV